jgi:Tol biopolymer transport system component
MTIHRIRLSAFVCAVCAVLVTSQTSVGSRPRPAGPAGGPISRVGTAKISQTISAVPADAACHGPAVSGNGRFVAFSSASTTLVAGDTNGANDVLVVDRFSLAITRVSVASDGSQGNAGSDSAALSGDGRYVAFASMASNLVPGDANGRSDVFVHDRRSGETTRVSVGSGGTEGNDHSYDPSISGDGRYVAFTSFASNLVTGDTNANPDVFVHDRQTNTTVRASLTTAGEQATGLSFQPAISFDGRHVAFVANGFPGSGPVNMVYRKRLPDGTLSAMSVRYNLTTPNGGSSEPSISRDGIDVAFTSSATNLLEDQVLAPGHVYTYENAAIRLESAAGEVPGNGASAAPAISATGTRVAFRSVATNLAGGDTNGLEDVFVHDRVTGVNQAVSVADAGTFGNGASSAPAISTDGTFVAFSSTATNLDASGDYNGVTDIFARRWEYPPATHVDFDGDGFGDIFGTKVTGLWSVWRGTGDGVYVGESQEGLDAPAAPVATGKLPWAKAPQGGDFDGDGLADLFDSKPTGAWMVARNDGAGGFIVESGTFDRGFKIVVIDLNSDCRSDLLLMNGKAGRYVQCRRTFNDQFVCTEAGPVVGGGVPYIAERSDAGQGYPDVFVHYKTGGRATWLVNNGNGTFGQTSAGTGLPKGWTANVADINGDGNSDVAFYKPGSGLWWVGFNDPGATPPSTIVMEPPQTTKWPRGQTFYPGDFDADGRQDFLLHKPLQKPRTFQLARDGGTWETKHSELLLSGWRVVGVGNLDMVDGDDYVQYLKATGEYVTGQFLAGGFVTRAVGGNLPKGLILVVQRTTVH